MPSIRVKRSNYSSLRDSGAHEQTSPTLTSLFVPNALTPGPSTPHPGLPRLETQRSMPALRPDPSPIILPRSRPRAGTVAGRVHSHCMRNSMRHSQVLTQSNRQNSGFLTGSPTSTSPMRLTPRHEFITLEGSQTNVMVDSNGEPGLIGSALSLPGSFKGEDQTIDGVDHHHDDIVDHLDVIDLQVATVSNLTNAANSILIPPLSWYSRKPVLVLTSPPGSTHPGRTGEDDGGMEPLEDSLDRHVDDVLRRPSKLRRTLLGVWSFLKTPMGVITAIYGFLVVFWGAAIVIFLVKIINLHNDDLQGFWVEVSSQVTNGLFTVTGIGLIPSRVLDTYRISKIWHYKRKTQKLRAKHGLPQLFDVDDLPDPAYDPNYVHVLTDEEQDDLHRQHIKFQHHQTWYRPHGTETHRAFPINTALLICLLNDGNSVFQILLCSAMWGFNRFERPPWTTGTLIPCSFLCGIFAAVFIWRGGQKTKRVQEVEDKLRAALSAQHPVRYSDNAERSTPTARKRLPPMTTEKQQADLEDAARVDELMTITVPPITRRKQ